MSLQKKAFPGQLDAVRDACDFVTGIVRDAGMGDDVIFHCEISVEEIFTNIVQYGYAKNGANKSVEIVVEQMPDYLQIVIIDEAPRFNPLQLNDPDPKTPLGDRPEGGWGVFFVKKFMDEVRYRYEKQRNHLILIKNKH